MKKIFSLSFISLLLISLSLFFPGAVQAQSENGLTIRLNRDMGFGTGSLIEGVFSLSATGPANLTRVVFLIDGQTMAEVTGAPFKLQFDTSLYTKTNHVFSARGYTSTGAELSSNEIPVTILSKDEAGGTTIKIVVPLLVGVMLISLLGTLVPTFLKRNKTDHLPLGTPRNYGIAGGTICFRCHRPYARSAYAPNLVIGKLTRCPCCGQIAITRAYPINILRQAEADELKNASAGEQIPQESEEERLRKEIENSRYV